MTFQIGRRELILGSAGVLLAGSARAQPPVVTPPQIEGPFYPYQHPAETDWDLVRLSTDDAPALGEVVHVFGTVKGYGGRPYAGALVEMWQADSREKYRHPDETDSHKRDARFQGYGRTMTDADGAFRFRTIRPPAYLYVEGESLNASDQWLNMVADPLQRASLIRPYEDGSSVERGAKRVRYDIVIIA
jgi:protocatechuate 3,4-dioxygenase beta subunit